MSVSTPQVGQSFSVFCDNEASSGGASGGQSSLPAPTGEWEHMPIRQETQKENIQGAGPWAGQKVEYQEMLATLCRLFIDPLL